MLLQANAQSYNQLTELKGQSAHAYHSAGHAQKASFILQKVDKVITYCYQLLEFKPTVTLLVLSKEDWKTFTTFPVYGMPHYKDNKTLIVAAEDNPFWNSFVPPLDQLPADVKQQVQRVYKAADGKISMESFFDLLAIHELGHAFHIQGGLTIQRKWMGELFANILLHTYVAENEPESLPALTLFPAIVINGGTRDLKYTSLQDLEAHYEQIAKEYPNNYGWYQCRWHSAAKNIYDMEGKAVFQKLWAALRDQKEALTDEQLLAYLDRKGVKPVADMVRNWDAATKR